MRAQKNNNKQQKKKLENKKIQKKNKNKSYRPNSEIKWCERRCKAPPQRSRNDGTSCKK